MARSLKKGPFVDGHLMKKVEALNAAGKKEVIKLGLDVQQSSLNLLSIHLQCITEENISQFM